MKESKVAPESDKGIRGRPKGSRDVDFNPPKVWNKTDPITCENFSSYLLYVFHQSKITVQELKNETGIPESTIYALMDEKRKNNPTLETLQKLASGFGISLHSFLSGNVKFFKRSRVFVYSLKTLFYLIECTTFNLA